MDCFYVRRMYENKEYVVAIKEGIKIANNLPNQFSSANNFAKVFISLQYAILASYDIGAYYDCYVIGRSLFRVVPIESKNLPIENLNFIALLERYFTASLYCYINKYKVDCKLDSIIKNLEFRYRLENIALNNKFIKNRQIYFDYNKGKLPYYEIECSVSFHIPVLDGKYEISFVDNIKHIIVTKITHNVGKEYELHYTRFKIQFYGFICASSDWKGPSIEDSIELFNTHKAVKVINDFLLLMSKIDNNNYYPRVYVEQIETHICSQYLASGEIYHYCNFTNFATNGIYTPPRSKEFNQDQHQKFKNLLNNKKELPLYEKLLILSKSDISVGLYTEAFMLLNSTLESMVYMLTKEIALGLNQIEKLNEFEKPKSKLPPSIFQYPKFLYTIEAIGYEKYKLLQKLIQEARNDNLRNNLMHGRVEIIEISSVKKCLKKIEEIKKILEEK